MKAPIPHLSRIALAGIAMFAHASAVLAATPLHIKDFRLHDFDEEITAALGHTAASVVYVREMASITEDQARLRRNYEPIGCNPFNVMLDGRIDETGFNCRSFFCVGYSRGPKQCEDRNGKAYGGVAEISRRMGLVTIQDVKMPYTDYASADRTAAMSRRIDELSPLKCTPMYLQEFDVVVGEGYKCEEIGNYPRYSGNFECMNDTRNKEGLVCDVEVREKELEFRASILGISSSSSSSSSSESSRPPDTPEQPSSSSSSSSAPSVTFTDVEEGKYGYTAIVTLASKGIVKGYRDGTYRPKVTMNRAEFVHLLMTGMHAGEIDAENNRCFGDVRSNQWYSPGICATKRLKWVNGYADGLFHPERMMKRSEGLKVIVASLGKPLGSGSPLPQGVRGDMWYSPYIRKAVELGIVLEPALDPEGEMTRADAAVWIYRSAKILEKI